MKSDAVDNQSEILVCKTMDGMHICDRMGGRVVIDLTYYRRRSGCDNHTLSLPAIILVTTIIFY